MNVINSHDNDLNLISPMHITFILSWIRFQSSYVNGRLWYLQLFPGIVLRQRYKTPVIQKMSDWKFVTLKVKPPQSLVKKFLSSFIKDEGYGNALVIR